MDWSRIQLSSNSVHLISFGDSTIITARRRLRHQAKKMRVFRTVQVATEKTLDAGFRKKHAELLSKHHRGFGYWIWKPQIVLQRLRTIPEGEILVYCDVGFYLNHHGRARLLLQLESLRNSGRDFLVFQSVPPADFPKYDGRNLPDHRDNLWTKGDLLDELQMRTHPETYTPTIQAGLFMIKQSESARRLVTRWRDIMSDKISLIDDSPSKSPNLDGFIENRHDQSVFSLLMKKEGSFIAESGFQFWYPEKDNVSSADWEAIADSPFQARRDKSHGRKPLGAFLYRVARLKKALARSASLKG